ncbi:MAG: tryptophan 7-halogenase [Rhodoferax sp.]|nr:tryptophan 7-halogenase [Rhodoferax sp.]
MQNKPLKTIVIVGGGTAGWMTAMALSAAFQKSYTIRVIESDEIGIVGVGEATIPMIKLFNKTAGIDENDFMKRTQGTFKLGIEFVNWGKLGDRYMHAFGGIGRPLGAAKFEHYWMKMNAQGKAPYINEYSISNMAALANKFMPPDPNTPNSPLGEITYAYHFDAGLYSKYLSEIGQSRGVLRTEGKIVRVSQCEGDGYVDAVIMENGERIEGDLFIDCSGFRGLLIEQTLKTGYEDWTHWLPCDRALAVPCESAAVLTPYTRSTAHRAGWQWRIPLQHRIGNGHVYSSKHMSDDEAAAILLANLDGKPLADPRPLKFTTGMRKKAWNKNVVAIGLSSGFMEPLESTSIHMVQSAIAQLIEYFPDQGFNQTDIDEFNRYSRFHYETIRNFIILHYHQNQRTDSQFWKACAHMEVPELLKQKMNLFKARGRIVRLDNELFSEIGWLQVMLGQNLRPENYPVTVDLVSDAGMLEYMEGIRSLIARCVDVIPDHAAYIAKFCAASPMK